MVYMKIIAMERGKVSTNVSTNAKMVTPTRSIVSMQESNQEKFKDPQPMR